MTLFGIFLTPVFYVLLRQRRARRVAAKLEPVGGAGAAVAVGTGGAAAIEPQRRPPARNDDA